MDKINTTQYKYKALVISGLGAFLGTLDASIVNISLPTISRDFATTIDLVGWVVLSYVIMIVSSLMVFGAVSEKKGYQFNYKYGFLIFLIGSFLCGISHHIYFLIGARVIQGVGAAMLMATGPALITHSFPEEERGRGLGVIAMVVSIGLMLGPPLGGYIIDLLGWRWIFFVNIPISAIAIYATIRFIGNFPVSDTQKKISFPGAGTLLTGLLSLIIAVMLYSHNVISLEQTIAILAISGIMFTLFFYFESNPRTRLIGLDIFKNRLFSFSVIAMFLIFVSQSSVTILMPFYLERIKSFQPKEVGLFLMILPVCIFFVAPLAGYLSDKIKARSIATIGIAIFAIGTLLMRNMDEATTTADIVIALMILGIAMGVFMTPNISCIMGSVDKRRLGTASGVNATIRNLGITIGVGLAVAIFGFYQSSYGIGDSDSSAAFIYGFQSVYEFVFIVVLLAIIFSWARGFRLKRKKSEL